jgi:hypothetical protein
VFFTAFFVASLADVIGDDQRRKGDLLVYTPRIEITGWSATCDRLETDSVCEIKGSPDLSPVRISLDRASVVVRFPLNCINEGPWQTHRMQRDGASLSATLKWTNQLLGPRLASCSLRDASRVAPLEDLLSILLVTTR